MASASVRISEIAWMGTSDDANNEWIELWNDGDAANLTGWTLIAEDGQPAIALQGTIAGGAYALLERTDDETVPSVAAFITYTGALGNDGETLELRDASGSVADRVVGGEGWSLGGSNEEKYTLQRTPSGEWVTAEPTPGRANKVVGAPVAPPTESGPSQSASPGAARSEPSRESAAKTSGKAAGVTPSAVQKLAPTLTLFIGEDRTVHAHVPVQLEAFVQNESGEGLSADTVRWSFGDGATSRGGRVTHTYRYPGEYVVVAETTREVKGTTLTARSRMVVRIVPLRLAVASADTLSIELVNESDEELDLSGFYLSAGKDFFRIPEHTVLLPRASIRFHGTVTKLVVTEPTQVGVFSPQKVLVAQHGATAGDRGAETSDAAVSDLFASGGAPDEPVASEELLSSTSEDAPPSEEEDDTTEAAAEASAGVPSDVSEGTLIAQAFGAGAPAQSTSGNLVWWLVGLGALIVTAIAAVLIARREEQEILEGFVIEEE